LDITSASVFVTHVFVEEQTILLVQCVAMFNISASFSSYRHQIALHTTKALPKYCVIFATPYIVRRSAIITQGSLIASAASLSQVGASTFLLLLIAGNFKMRRWNFFQ
jgi:hypothetical protein